jgi:hypothetical protein
MSSQTEHTVVVQIFQPQRLSNNTELYPTEFMPYLTNKVFEAAAGTTLADTAYLPIIKKISAIKTDCSDLVPKSTPVSIEIDNRPGTFGFDRKFTDELDRSTIIGQNCNIYICSDEPGSFANAADLDGVLVVCKIRDVVCNTKDETVLINAETYKIVTQPLCAKPYIGLPGLTESGSSASLPFIVGFDVYTKLIPLNSELQAAPASSPIGSEVQAYYGYCTGRSIAIPQEPDDWYIRDFVDNTYKQFTRKTTPSTDDSQYDRSIYAFSANLDLDTNTEYCDYIKMGTETNTYNRVITGGSIQLRGVSTYVGGSAAVNGAVTIEIYLKSDKFAHVSAGARPNKTPIARATIEKADYATEFVTNANFVAYFQLDKPVYIPLDADYAVYYSVTHDDDDETNVLRIPRYTGPSANRWRRKTGKNWRKQASSTLTMSTKWWVLGAGIHTSGITTDENGNQPYYAMVGTAVDFLGQENFDCTNLDIVVKTEGLLDDSSGTVTGSANSLIATIPEVLRLLHFTYYPSSNTWDSTFQSDWNDSINPSSTDFYYRTPSFAATSNQTADQAIRELCRQFYAAVVPIFGNFDNVGSFIEGKYKEGFVTITDNEIISSKYEYKDTRNVVNSIEMAYQPDLLGLQATDVIQRGGPRGFRYYLQRSDEATPSRDIFGVKGLTNINYTYLNYPIFAGAIADLLLINLALPAEYFEIEVPFEKYAADLQHFNQIRVFSPRFPSFYGANVGPTLPVYDDGSEIEEGGMIFTEEARGQYIRGSIEGIEFISDASKPATVRYTCRRLRDNNPFYE